MSSDTIVDNTCAACGKKGDNLKACTACRTVKYCNKECQVAHRKHHKKACKLLYDEKLFKEVSSEECPICLVPIPRASESQFKACCGKFICHGCIYAMEISEGKDLCAFCRAPEPSHEREMLKQIYNLMDKGNGQAFNHLGGFYCQGIHGKPQDYQKANELMLKGGELGCAEAYYNLGLSYKIGRGVAIDEKKAKYYWELAAMGGNVLARHNVGALEGQAGNIDRALKHFAIAAKAGDVEALDMIKYGFMDGDVTKDEYANILRAYHERHKEMNSDSRFKAEQARLLGISRKIEQL